MVARFTGFAPLALTFTLLAACGAPTQEPADAAPDVHAPSDVHAQMPDASAEMPDVFATEDSATELDASAMQPDVATSLPDASAQPDAGVSLPDSGAPRPVVIDARNIPPEAALYTLDRTRYGVRDVGRALDAVLSAASRPDNVILYVHGRACGGGGEPMKSLDGAMPELARDYTAAPIMLFWPGSDDGCPLGFPEDRARASGPALAAVLGDLYNYRIANRARVAGVRFTLITHSMGSIVLEAATSVGGFATIPATAFDTAIINSAASAARAHDAWVSRVGVSALRFVTVNSGDNVLTAAGLGRGTRLGKSIDGVTLASGFDYVDFSANNVNHAYYIASGQSGAGMRAFYQRVMNGLPFEFVGAAGVGSNTARDGARVHVFNGR